PTSTSFSCPHNIDFEAGDFTGWTAQWGGGRDTTGGAISDSSIDKTKSIAETPAHYFKAGRQTITNTSSPQDFYGKFPVVAPGGGGHSLKLGDSLGNHGIDRVQYVINVPNTPNN